MGSGGDAKFGEDPEVGEKEMSRQPRMWQSKAEIEGSQVNG